MFYLYIRGKNPDEDEMLELSMNPTIFGGESFLHTPTLASRLDQSVIDRIGIGPNQYIQSHYTKIDCAGTKNGNLVYRIAEKE